MCVGESSYKSLSVYVNKYRSLLAKVSEGTPMAHLSYDYLNTILNMVDLAPFSQASIVLKVFNI